MEVTTRYKHVKVKCSRPWPDEINCDIKNKKNKTIGTVNLSRFLMKIEKPRAWDIKIEDW